MAWAIGQKLQGGKYIIDRQLGEGGFGITYRVVNNNGHLLFNINFSSISTRDDLCVEEAGDRINFCFCLC